MDHQSFRFYIPGITFLTPIYFVICWLTINNVTNPDIRVFVLIGGITIFPAIALPIGWWIYNAYRVWWLKFTKGGYENKEFMGLIRKDTKPFYDSTTNSVFIDFSHIKGIESWIKVDLKLFQKSFYPFTTFTKFEKEIQKIGFQLKYTEAISDFVLWKDSGYDYARSISSVRYGLESSVFAILLGVIYAIGIKSLWLSAIHPSDDNIIVILWECVLLLLTLGLIFTLYLRWQLAYKEYDARLTLTTLTSMTNNYFNISNFTDYIPLEIMEKVNNLKLAYDSYAAFDLDNTLLVDDIGEAVFATLVKRKLIQNFTWADYLRLLVEDRESAYIQVIEIMNGLHVNQLKEITYEILNSEETHIDIDEFRIPIPKPNLTMQSLISFLRMKDIDIYVITASNKISAEIICWEHFGIPSSHVIGADIPVDVNNKISFKSIEIPFAIGKVRVLKDKFNHKPIITGGDGPWDKFLLDYTVPEGIRLWLGESIEEYQAFKNHYYKELDFFHIRREH